MIIWRVHVGPYGGMFFNRKLIETIDIQIKILSIR